MLGSYGVFHAEVNSTEKGVGGDNMDSNRDRNVNGGPVWAEQDWEWGNLGARANRVGSRKRRAKRLRWYGYVQDYWGFYTGEVANTVWDL